ncbi:F-box/FBD/LRR-repeat protein [Vitis vinifera]|uniref:F-box/FBD/LRR-repeat protein n=1 Tax=Vitis vinifera TaxID=29760 RepID=A0A438EA14_VITVI|nr:F-box/FBD/LRR-repeat protein [Vitis vinifera]
MKRIPGAADRISNLPSNIIDNILVRLPIHDAVRTSILSRKWRYKWLTLPQLVFEDSFSEQMTKELGVLSEEKLLAAVYQALLLHKGPIVKFSLAVPEFKSCSSVDHWIHFLSYHEIQEFSLSFSTGSAHVLPYHIFYFLQLRHLKLRLCQFKPPPAFGGFSRLISLEFISMDFEAGQFGTFISNSPLLEQLRGVFESISFKNTPVLAVVSIALNRAVNQRPGCSKPMKLADSLPALEKLYVGYNFLKLLRAGDSVAGPLGRPLEHLKVLRVWKMHMEDRQGMLDALHLIKNSPNLQKLIIVIEPSRVAVVENLVGQDFSACCLKRLEEVELHFISGIGSEVELIKLVLANAPGLKKMKIIPSENLLFHARGLEILKKLIQFPRASPKAEIKYSDSKSSRMRYKENKGYL